MAYCSSIRPRVCSPACSRGWYSSPPSFLRGAISSSRNPSGAYLGGVGTGIAQFCIAVYGGYFGGGIGFLMLAALSLTGMQTRGGAATKNVLAAVMNASAVLIFAFSGAVNWGEAAVLGVGSIAGGLIGAKMLSRFPENILRNRHCAYRGGTHRRPVPTSG